MREVFQNSSTSIRVSRTQGTILQAGVNIQQLLAGLGVLVLGTLFYYFCRPAEHTYFLKFLSINLHNHKFLSPVLFTLANSLPTFIHVFAFILMTAAFAASQKREYLLVCLNWFTIDVFFEIGQGLDNILIPIIPNWFSGIFLLENTKDYFLHGRFDYLDLFSIVVGSIAAYFFLIITGDKRRGQNEKQISCNH
jgi:general stress protein CsbA